MPPSPRQPLLATNYCELAGLQSSLGRLSSETSLTSLPPPLPAARDLLGASAAGLSRAVCSGTLLHEEISYRYYRYHMSTTTQQRLRPDLSLPLSVLPLDLASSTDHLSNTVTSEALAWPPVLLRLDRQSSLINPTVQVRYCRRTRCFVRALVHSLSGRTTAVVSQHSGYCSHQIWGRSPAVWVSYWDRQATLGHCVLRQ